LTEDIWEQTETLRKIFMPFAEDRTARAQSENIRFVHYTSAEIALRIIREKRIIMRNTLCMNDYREFEHGLEQLANFFKPGSATRTIFFSAMNECGANFS
jgi:hypothetical protein